MKNELKRDLKTPGAILMGLGSIVGTSIFVSIAIATQVAGNGIIIAVIIAAVLATFNGLSSAQLAAAHPVSVGTYEYGYRFLGSYFGFTAGWMFLLAKSASAATAVLGCVGYLFYALGINTGSWFIVGAGLLLLLIMTYLVSGGISRSNQANKIIVSVTLLGLAALVVVGLYSNGIPTRPIVDAFTDTSGSSILYASALMFVAYTGYGRIATLGEEVSEPRTTIPKAIILAMVFIVILYLTVSLTALQVMDKIGRERGWSPMTRPQFEESRKLRGANVVGSPQEVIEKILFQHKIFSHDRFLLQMSVGSIPHEKLLRSIELFATEVAPAVNKE